MVDLIRPKSLPTTGSVAADAAFIMDDGTDVFQVTAAQIVAAAPVPSLIYSTLGAFKAAAISNKVQTLRDPSLAFGLFNWETANAPYTADNINVIKADSTALSVGAWVRQKASGLTFHGAGTGEVYTDPETLLKTAVDVRRFGAVCDGTTNDTAAVQAAVTYCLSTTRPRALLIPGRCKITASIIIDRLVDTSISEFRIIGQGEGAGFYVTTAIKVFDTSLNYSVAPQSEFVTFENIQFEGVALVESYAISGGFLRTTFVNCYFHRMNCMNSAVYAQEIKFVFCKGRYFPGPAFFKAPGGFAIFSNGGKYQNGAGTVFDLTDISGTHGVNGCGFHQDTAESNDVSYILAGLIHGLSISGLYAEGNGAPALDFTAGGSNYSVSVTGSFFSPKTANAAISTFYDIKWGAASGISGGNYCTARLHDNSSVSNGELRIVGDYAVTSLTKSDILSTVMPAGALDGQKNIVAHAGGGQGSAVQITKPFAFLSTVATAGDSVKLPSAAPGNRVLEFTIYNFGANAANVYPATGDQINVAGANVAYSLASAAKKTFYCINAGAWLAP